MSMKKLVLVLLLLSSLNSLFARSFGYFVAQDGEKTSSNAYGGASFGLVLQPFQRSFLNPSLFVSLSMGTDMQSRFLLPAATMGVTIDLFRTMNHPFMFIAHNKIAYDPSVSVGMQLRFDDSTRPALYFGASPFKFSQPDFWYEFCSPFGTYSNKGWSWGVAIFRFTFLCL